MSSAINRKGLGQLEQFSLRRRNVQRGDALFCAGDRFTSLYAVCAGSLKSTLSSADRHEQVTGIYVTGDLVGWDGIDTGRHWFDMRALENSEVQVVPCGKLDGAARLPSSLRTYVLKTMSREIVRDHKMMLLLGSMRAEERLAAFLLNFRQRLNASQRTSGAFALQMTRAEIGSLLGLQLETVSRAFSQLARKGLIELNHKAVRIIDPQQLRRIVQGASLTRARVVQ